MKHLLIIIIPALLLSSCISFHVTEKDLFNVNKVSRLNSDIKTEEVYFNTTDSVELYGWFVRCNNARGTFLYFGGDGYYIWNRFTPDIINALTSLKMNLMLIDYRGYGRSSGSPSIGGLYNDGYSAYIYLLSRGDIDTACIVVYGHSFGAFVATRVANAFPVSGIVLEGAISNAPDMRDAALENNAPWYIRWLVNIDADSAVLSLDNINEVNRMNCPMLILTGEKDNIAPPAMGKKIFETASSPVKSFIVIPDGEHKNLYFTNEGGRRDNYIKALSKFLDNVFSTQKH
jgi:fermentation-respiration switch protein FrsA (DUF1100 family)